jgi:hypothetical protein
MNPGPRYHRQASLRVATPEGFPDDMRDDMREIISVTSTARGRGEATALMHTVCAEADRDWKTLLIQVRPFDDGAVSADKLMAWYSRFGFKVIQDDPCLMARSPERPRIAR